MTHPPPAALKRFLRPYDRVVRDLALELRKVVLDEMAPCYENIYDAYSAVAIGYGATDRMSDGVVHIAVYPRHVNLGFNAGAMLPDPANILKGRGRRVRHITIKTGDDLQAPALRAYIQQACKMALAERRKLGKRQARPAKTISIVKAVYENKRRPARNRS